MKNNIILTILLIVIVAIAAILLWSPETIEQNSENDIEIQQAELREGWEVYKNTEFGFTVHHPAEASIQREGDIYIKFTYLGAPQAIGEVTDGFTFTVGTHTSDQTLQQFAASNYQEQLQAGTPVQAPEQTVLRGNQVYTYRVETLGEVTVYVVQGSRDNRFHTISYIVADPNDQGYESVIMDMLRSFQVYEQNSDQ